MKMARIFLAFIVFFSLAILPLAFSQTADKSFSINYNSAGLCIIEVRGGSLHHVWHVLKVFEEKEPAVVRQDLKSYDRYEARIRLTHRELDFFQDWLTEHKINRFNSIYASASKGRSYAAAFETSLSVTRYGKNHTISWSSDSEIPEDLKRAVDKLIKICEEMQKSRQKQAF